MALFLLSDVGTAGTCGLLLLMNGLLSYNSFRTGSYATVYLIMHQMISPMDSKQWIIRKRMKAKRKRQALQQEIDQLTGQADREQMVLGHPLPATLKKIHHRKLKLNEL